MIENPTYAFLLKYLETKFAGCKIVTEHKFDTTRNYRLDIAIIYYDIEKIAIEIEGGVYTRGRHTRGAGFMKDIEKYNRAAFLGWRVFRIAGHEAVDPCKVVPFVDMIKEFCNAFMTDEKLIS